MPIIRCMIMVSSKPARGNQRHPGATPFDEGIGRDGRTVGDPVDTIKQCRKIGPFFLRRRRESRQQPSCNRPGVDGDLVVVTEPSSPITTTSVKVPRYQCRRNSWFCWYFPARIRNTDS